ncbi:MAG: C40 family peptidase [Bacteroidales bacterium]|nr:C40 family peptidase [Bacteroidales bacterium]
MKKIVIVLIIIFLFAACTKRSYISNEVIYSVGDKPVTVINHVAAPLVEDVVFRTEQELINSVIAYAHSLEGTPYKWGGTTPVGFDCSGFVQHVYKKFGVNVPRMPVDMAAMSTKIDRTKIRKGDIVYFRGSNVNSSEIGHVALVISDFDGDFKMIHATTSKGVIVNSFSEYDYWKLRYLFATRFDKEDLIKK